MNRWSPSGAGREREEARIATAAAEGEAKVLREQVTAERERAELDYWTAGGPLARALRVLLYRRGRP